MSVISSFTVTPNRVELLVRHLAASGDDGQERDELSSLLVPPSLSRVGAAADDGEDDESGGGAVVSELLREARALGLLEEMETNRLRVPTARRTLVGDGLLAYLEGILTVPERAEAHGQRWFPRALAWFLAQDPARAPSWGENPRTRIQAQCGHGADPFELTNNARFRNFGYWARYLGYAARLRLTGSGPRIDVLVPDPTAALARHLRVLFGARPKLGVRELLAALAERTGVFEGGAARSDIEALWTGQAGREQSALSPATSAALGRLARRSLLELDVESDAAVTMDLLTWPATRRVSHVRWR